MTDLEAQVAFFAYQDQLAASQCVKPDIQGPSIPPALSIGCNNPILDRHEITASRRQIRHEAVVQRRKARREATVGAWLARREATAAMRQARQITREAAAAARQTQHAADVARWNAISLWRYHHPAEARIKSKERAWRRQGIANFTHQRYLDLLESQDNKCRICGTAFGTAMPNVDHDHSTGKVRGLLCARCNISLGGFKDDTDLLSNAITYLAPTS